MTSSALTNDPSKTIDTKTIATKIIATGGYLPEKILTNSDLEKIVDTSHDWIFERTGIVKRHIASDSQLTSDLAVNAARICLEQINFSAQDIDMIIVATTTPDLTFPSTATIVQKRIGANNAFAFDIQAVCSGFVFAVATANSFIVSGQVRNALVIGAETLSRILNWQDRNSCVLFGDGAGAILLEKSSSPGILSTDLNSDGNLTDILKTSGGTSFNQSSGFITMSGKEVFRHAVEKMSSSVNRSLGKANLTTADINLLVPHQANIRILDAVAKKLNLTKEQVVVTVGEHANTSAASIPLALDYANRRNRIKKGDIVVLEALGGGLTWGSVVIKW
jgi:3-oxoacyl-[acyl-carrier-protein] synthase-3